MVTNTTPVTSSGVTRLLRVEALALLVASVIGYASLGGGWALFAALFLVPDVTLFAYFAGPRVGAAAYNSAHSTVGPAILAALSWKFGATGGLEVALIWLAHIGLDRALGYGLKYASRFGDTHLGKIGHAASESVSWADSCIPAHPKPAGDSQWHT